jgi:hypothetical protein
MEMEKIIEKLNKLKKENKELLLSGKEAGLYRRIKFYHIVNDIYLPYIEYSKNKKEWKTIKKKNFLLPQDVDLFL